MDAIKHNDSMIDFSPFDFILIVHSGNNEAISDNLTDIRSWGGGKIKPGVMVDAVKSFTEKETEDLEISFDHKKTIDDAFGILK